MSASMYDLLQEERHLVRRVAAVDLGKERVLWLLEEKSYSLTVRQRLVFGATHGPDSDVNVVASQLAEALRVSSTRTTLDQLLFLTESRLLERLLDLLGPPDAVGLMSLLTGGRR